MTMEEAIVCLKGMKNYGRDTFTEQSDWQTSLDMAIEALEQEPCEDEEYEKNLNELKEQIFKEGNTLISKQDLLERFVEIDNEYKNSHWNLLQILANIDILIGKEPCEDCISRQAVLDKAVYTETEEGWSGMTVDVKDIEALPPVSTQKPKTGHWEDKFKCSECGKEQPKILCGERIIRHWSDYCPNCGAKMVEQQESEDAE